jgi:hypothetical protein
MNNLLYNIEYCEQNLCEYCSQKDKPDCKLELLRQAKEEIPRLKFQIEEFNGHKSHVHSWKYKYFKLLEQTNKGSN